MGSAESLIRREAIRFMRQQQSSKSNLEIVLVDQPAEAPPSEPSSEMCGCHPRGGGELGEGIKL